MRVLAVYNNKLLVANAGCNSLTIVDLKDITISDTICLNNLINKSKPIFFSKQVPFFRTHCMAVNDERGFLYLVNSYDDSIFQIDLKKNEIVNTIYAGSNPSHVQILDGRLIVTNSDSNSISIIDEESFTLVENISVGIKPHDIKVDEKTKKIYVANSNDYSISVFTLDENEISNIKLKAHPLHLHILNDLMYILSSQTNGMSCSYISVLDLNTYEVINTIPLDEVVIDMEIISENLLYITNIGNGHIYKINIDEDVSIERFYLGGMPTSILWDKNKLIYITDIERDLLMLFDIEKECIVKKLKVGNEPNALLVL